MKKVVIVNDTSVAKHFGCEVVMDTLKGFANKPGHSILTGTVPVKKDATRNPALLKPADVVIINAEGSLHHGRHPNLLNICDLHPNVHVVNGSYQELSPRQLRQLRKAKSVSARESKSCDYLISKGVNCDLVPDVFLYNQPFTRPEITERFGHFDSVVNPAPKSLVVLSKKAYLESAGRHRRWITGRFHGICLAVMWDVPFFAYASNTWKNLGMMKDLRLEHRYSPKWNDDFGGALIDLPLTEDYSRYREDAQEAIALQFEHILGS